MGVGLITLFALMGTMQFLVNVSW